MFPTWWPYLRFSEQDSSATLLLTLHENVLPGYDEFVLLLSALYNRHAIMIGKVSRNADYCPILYETVGSQLMTNDFQKYTDVLSLTKKYLQASSKQSSKHTFLRLRDFSRIPANNGTESRSEWTKAQQITENVHPNLVLRLLLVRSGMRERSVGTTHFFQP